jgi:hypothetical protein
LNNNKNNKNKNSINKSEKNKFIKYLVKNDLLNTLLFLISTYAYPDITNEIINLFSIISIEIKSLDNATNNFFSKENNINFISNSILPIYIRIKPLQIEEETNNNNNKKSSNKKIAMSEIVFHKNQSENLKNWNDINDNNLDNNSENILFINDNENDNENNKEDDDEIDIIENSKRFINSEKVKIRHRKQSGDNFHHIRKLNLEKISTLDLGSNIQEENIEQNTNINNEKKTKSYHLQRSNGTIPEENYEEITENFLKEIETITPKLQTFNNKTNNVSFQSS